MTNTAFLAAGCFWGVEELLSKVPGVVKTEVGYTGGKLDHPTYNDVKTGKTGHAEAIRVDFDPHVLSYEELLDLFFKLHDPTTRNAQGNDIGTQYRSVIFYYTPEQKTEAEASIARLTASHRFSRPIVTQVVAATDFWRAEDYHQHYLDKNGLQNCRF